MGNKRQNHGDLDPRYVRAAYLFVFEGKTEPEIGADLGVTDRTIRSWKANRAQWMAATMKALELHAPEAAGIAFSRLLASAKGEPGSPGVTAANSILDRVLGKPPDKHELTGKDGGPLQVVVFGTDDHGAGRDPQGD